MFLEELVGSNSVDVCVYIYVCRVAVYVCVVYLKATPIEMERQRENISERQP